MTALKRGFTLIELLIVMAILGVLAVVVLVAINPVQQLARTRDAGRKSGVTQLGHAMEAYYTSHGGAYAAASGWQTTLVTAGEIPAVVTAPTWSVGIDPGCGTGTDEGGYCYKVDGTNSAAVVYVQMESDSEDSKCVAAGGNAYFVWSTIDGRGGVASAEPSAGTTPAWCAVQ